MMKRKTVSEINRYEAPLCETCLVATESTVLTGSGLNDFSVKTEGFVVSVDDDNWM